VSKFLTVHQQN